MLCLTRKEGEALVIGGAVVSVLEIDGNRVRLGVEAPRCVPIMREELLPVARPADALDWVDAGGGL